VNPSTFYHLKKHRFNAIFHN